MKETTFTKEQVLEMIDEALNYIQKDDDQYSEYGPGICYASGWVKAAMEHEEDRHTNAVINAIMEDIEYQESRE